jgi:hypothetical protein
MLKCLAVLAVVTGCTDDGSEGIGASSAWVLTLGPGTQQRATTEPCATIAPINIELSADGCHTSGCGAGEQCVLMYTLDNAGRVDTLSFSDDCGSGLLSCGGDHLGQNPDVSCWFAAPNTPYCKYPGELVGARQPAIGTVHDPEPAGIR